jgi:hypothetical protein
MGGKGKEEGGVKMKGRGSKAPPKTSWAVPDCADVVWWQCFLIGQSHHHDSRGRIFIPHSFHFHAYFFQINLRFSGKSKLVKGNYYGTEIVDV